MSIDWLSADWPVSASVKVISTSRIGGVSLAQFESLNLGDHVGDDPLAVAENRARLRREADLPAEPCWLRQVHGVAVKNLDTEPRQAEADAAFTRQPDRVCAILTADCLPVVLAVESGEMVAAVHAGWRGLAAGVIEATVQEMQVPAQRILAWLGPAIGPRHFEVGGEVRQAFLLNDAGAGEAFTSNAGGRYLADLRLLARRRLAALGVSGIYGGGDCTYASPDRYFSFRRDGSTGRQATLIWRSQR